MNIEISADAIRTQNQEPNATIFKDLSRDDMKVDQKYLKAFKKFVDKFNPDLAPFGAELTFFNMRDSQKRMERNELDGLVYDKIGVSFFMPGVEENFEFYIKNYHELVNYKILIIRD